METIKVVAALIKNADKYLIGLRSTGKYKGFWEFPGGKIEENEELEAALMREIHEEFEVNISIEKLLFKIEHTYPEFILEMYCFLATSIDKDYVLMTIVKQCGLILKRILRLIGYQQILRLLNY